MKISFLLVWLPSNASRRKTFRSPHAQALFDEYGARISKFTALSVSRSAGPVPRTKAGLTTWLCDRGHGSRMFSSEELAHQIEKLQSSGTKELQIVIGGPDGFSEDETARWNPELKWSFGPLTLPHELAAIVAAEQLYRAWTQIRNMPYHSGH